MDGAVRRLSREPPKGKAAARGHWDLSLCQAVPVAAQDVPSGNVLWLGCVSSLFGFHTPDLSAKLTFFSKISLPASLGA